MLEISYLYLVSTCLHMRKDYIDDLPYLGVEAKKFGSNGMSVRPNEIIKTDSNETSKRSSTTIQDY